LGLQSNGKRPLPGAATIYQQLSTLANTHPQIFQINSNSQLAGRPAGFGHNTTGALQNLGQ
jgi:hypothetical protein